MHGSVDVKTQAEPFLADSVDDRVAVAELPIADCSVALLAVNYSWLDDIGAPCFNCFVYGTRA